MPSTLAPSYKNLPAMLPIPAVLFMSNFLRDLRIEFVWTVWNVIQFKHVIMLFADSTPNFLFVAGGLKDLNITFWIIQALWKGQMLTFLLISDKCESFFGTPNWLSF